ncbi:MAG: hypothetical protein ACE5R4_02765 [Armatimonadota bacterium]
MREASCVLTPLALFISCLAASPPAAARHEVDGDLLTIGRAEGTWWYGGRTGGLRLLMDRGSVHGELSGAFLTDVGEHVSERKGLVEGTVVEQRVRLLARVEGATAEERARWRITGTMVPSQGIAHGVIEGGGSWQVTFPPVNDVAEYGYRAFKLLLDQILAEPKADTLVRHYLGRRGQLKRYASWLLKEPDDPRRESRAAREDRLRALGEVNRGYLRLHQEVWGGALRACYEGLAPAAPETAGLGGLAGGGHWTDPTLWRAAKREAPRLARRWQERCDLLAGLLGASAGKGLADGEFSETTQESAALPRKGGTPVWGRSGGGGEVGE